MIIDLPEEIEITTVAVGFDEFEHEHIEDTVLEAKEWIRRDTTWPLWRFLGMRINYDERRIEIDFLRMAA